MTDSLWQSFANANAAAVEAEALLGALEQAVGQGALGAVRASDEWEYDTWSDEDGWVNSYLIYSVAIHSVGPPKAARGTLSVAMSFYRPEDRSGENWAGGRRAKIYAGVAPTKKAWDENTLLVDGSGRSEVAEAKSRYRWFRIDDESAWFFCVTLDTIDSLASLRREIVLPLSHLLSGRDERTAFAGCLATLPTPKKGAAKPRMATGRHINP